MQAGSGSAWCAARPRFRSLSSRARQLQRSPRILPPTKATYASLPFQSSVHFQRLLEQSRRQEDASDTEALEELGPNASRLECAHDPAVGPDSLLVETEDFVHADHVFFHARDLRDVDHFAAAVAHAGDLYYQGYGGSHLLADCSF